MESMNTKLSPPNITDSVLLTSAVTITSSPSNNTNVQPGLWRVDPLVLGLAAGIPSVVALALGIILAVTCIRQRTSCRCNEANHSQEEHEECKYEQTLPKPPRDTCMSTTKDPISAYENEDQKPPRRLPPPVPTEPSWVGNKKQGPCSAGRPSFEVSSEAVYEIHVPFAITEKRA